MIYTKVETELRIQSFEEASEHRLADTTIKRLSKRPDALIKPYHTFVWATPVYPVPQYAPARSFGKIKRVVPFTFQRHGSD